MLCLILFFLIASTLGTVIGYTVWSMATEVLVGIGVVALMLILARMAFVFVKPCFKATDEAVRDAEESASR